MKKSLPPVFSHHEFPGQQRFLRAALLPVLALPFAFLQANAAQQLYLTAGQDSVNLIIQGATLTTVPQVTQGGNPGNEYAIGVVGNQFRTLGSGDQATSGPAIPGAEYDQYGTFSGVSYAYPAGGMALYDGASDGTHFYSADFQTGNIYRFAQDWTNPTLLFDSGISDALGITFDPTDNTLWIAGYNSSSLSHFALDGTLLGSFATTGTVNIGFVAFNPDNNSLYVGGLNQGTIDRYSRAGALLDSQFYAGLTQNVLGGEFGAAPVPEASTWGAVGVLGTLAGATWLRRRRA
jgi:hypothetical protein